MADTPTLLDWSFWQVVLAAIGIAGSAIACVWKMIRLNLDKIENDFSKLLADYRKTVADDFVVVFRRHDELQKDHSRLAEKMAALPTMEYLDRMENRLASQINRVFHAVSREPPN